MLDPHAFVNQEGLDAEKFVIATYLISCKTTNMMETAQAIAIEQSTGTWTEVPEDLDTVRKQSLAKVVSINEVPHSQETDPDYSQERTFVLTIAYPHDNINLQFPQMLTAVYGNISMFGKIKVLDIRLPKPFLNAFSGPAFGIDGLRKLVAVKKRPLMCAVFKPSTGATPKVLARMVLELGMGGVDIVKDDELLSDPYYCTIEDRLEEIMKTVKEVEQARGRKLLYALNVSDAPKVMSQNIETALEMGANCLSFNVPSIGFASFAEAVEQIDGRVPVLANSEFGGSLFGSPHHGLNSSLVLGKFMRLTGADMLVCPSPYGKVAMAAEQVQAIAQNLRAPMHHFKSVSPATSSGLHPGQVQQLLNDFGPDTVVSAGGAYHGHPDGIRAGVRAFKQAIDAWEKGVDVVEYAKTHPELQKALDKWGLYSKETPTNYALTSS